MYPVVHQCPVCKQDLEVTKLHCRQCDTSIEGHFTLGRFHSLSPEQIHFAETFIRCEGKINRVEEILKISYPTVRARLHQLIRDIGYEVKEDEVETANSIDRQAILQNLAEGKLTAAEAALQLSG